MLHIDTPLAAVLRRTDVNQSEFVVLNRRPQRSCDLRNWRGLLAVLVAGLYLLSGVLHSAHDIDVTSPSGGSEIASILDDGSASHGDHNALAGHHCHGCFSVAVAQPAQASAGAELVAATPSPHHPVLSGIAPDTDSPPPKNLT